MIEAEAPSLAQAETFSGCHYDPTPFLVIQSKMALLDGNPVDELLLGEILRNKQDLRAELDAGMKTEIIVQVASGVSENRVSRFLARARSEGFVDVVRMPAVSALPSAVTTASRTR